MYTYYFNLGSNIGDRHATLTVAMDSLSQLGCKARHSQWVESEPWGFVSKNQFVNVGLRLVSDLEPEAMLQAIHRIETRLGSGSHRTADGQYADRVLDIDIVAIDEMTISTEHLVVPHPHLTERTFFLQPMAELAPDWRHPATGLTARQLLEALK